MKQLCPIFLLAASLVVSAMRAGGEVVQLEDGFAEEAWERTAFSPCKGGDSIRKLESGDYVHIFNNTSGRFVAPADREVTVTYLIVGGGGGGGNCNGGGGGGGQVREGMLTIPAGTVCTITVGRGGASRNASVDYKNTYYYANFYLENSNRTGDYSGVANVGDPSSIAFDGTTVTAVGGAGGGCHQTAGTAAPTESGVAVAGKGGNASSGIGGQGGAGYFNYTSCADGASGRAGAGGDGCSTYITGEQLFFAGGGGGGGRDGNEGGFGGQGGGGDGSMGNSSIVGHCGADNTGGGGGGGGGANSYGYKLGGMGGSGVVIIRYSGTGLTPVVNGCIDRTAGGRLFPWSGDVSSQPVISIGYYAAASGAGAVVHEAAAVGGNDIHQLSTGEFVHRFTQSGTFKAPAGESLTVDYLVVGGGGSGGNNYCSSGGGAGGVRYGRLTVAAGESVAVTVGAGGAVGTSYVGLNGGNSVLAAAVETITANGGGSGGGGGWNGDTFGGSGGSSGGRARLPVDFEQGTSGGYLRSDGSRGGAGGGGAGWMGGCDYVDAGDSKTHGGNGGSGVLCAITGEELPYAAGGGGCAGSDRATYGGKGGSGIGGNGASWEVAATAPVPNTGSGGGGGGKSWSSTGSGSSAGADGVVILRYRACHLSVQWEFLGGVLMWTAKANATLEDTDAKLYYAKTAAELDDLGACAFVTGDFVSAPDDASVRLVRWNLSRLDRDATYFLKAVIADSAGSIASAVVSSKMPGYSAYSVGDGGEVLFMGGGDGVPPEVLHKFTDVGAQPFSAPSTLVPLSQFPARILLVSGGGGGAMYSGGGGAGVFDGTVQLVGGQTYSVTVGDGGAGSVYSSKGYGDDGGSTLLAGGATGAMIEVLATGGGGAPQTYVSGHGGGYVYRLNDEVQASREGVAGNSGGYGTTRGGSSMINASGAVSSSGSVSKGGDGPSSDISGEAVYYGGGGGSGRPGNGGGVGGAGGLGGGGTGGVKDKTYAAPTPGVDGLGGGGGGGTYEGGGAVVASGARGGSGIAYIRYAPQPYDTSVPFGEVRELELQADGIVRLETYLYLLGDEATSAKVVLLWGGEGEELTNEVVLDEGMIVTSASRVFYLEQMPFGTNLDFVVRFTNNDGVNEGKYSSTQQHPLAIPPLTLFEPVEPVVSVTNLTVTFTGEVAVVGYGSTTIQVRYGPERDMLIHTNKPVYQVTYEEFGGEGPYPFATRDIPCDKKGDKMPTVYYVYDLLETAGGTNRVLQSWTSEIRKAKIYTPQGTTFGIR